MMDQRSTDQVIELLESAHSLLDVGKKGTNKGKLPMQIEIRTLEFWRAIIAECIATFFYVMLLSSTHQALNHPKDSIATVQMFSAITAGLAMVTLTQAFLQVSGSHFNPSITVACVLMKKISVLRAAMYICAQCGGAIAGAALVYGVYGRNGAKDQFGQASIANFGMEFILTFLVAYVFFSVSANLNKLNNNLQSSLSIGLAYMASLAAYRGSLNPARALGPAFVADSFDYHWVFWVGPILGASCGGFCYTFIFNMKKPRWRREKEGPETMSVKSDDDMLDDLERVRQYKTNMMATYNEGLNGGGVGSVYNTAIKPYKRGAGPESVYGGTKSLFNVPPYGEGRRTPGFDSKSMYGGTTAGYIDDGRQSRAQLKRSMSVHSRVQRRHPQDNLPDEPAAYRQPPNRQTAAVEHSRQVADSGANDRLESTAYTSDAMYREYIRQKNVAADQTAPLEQYSGSSSGQCSGSSSGYYSTAREQEEHRREQLRADHELIREQKQEHFHRRERSVASTRSDARRIADGHHHPAPAGQRAQNYTPSTTSSYGY